jgi:hypothetical protein
MRHPEGRRRERSRQSDVRGREMLGMSPHESVPVETLSIALDASLQTPKPALEMNAATVEPDGGATQLWINDQS